MQSGQLDTLFEVLQRTEQKNSAGQVKQIWTVIGDFCGEVLPVSTTNFVNSGVMGNAIIARIHMRPNDFPELLESHRLRDVDTGKLYDITGILPVEKNRKQAVMVSNGKL